MKMDHEIFQEVINHPKQHNYQPRGRGGYVSRGGRGRGGRPATDYQRSRQEDDNVMFDRSSKQPKE
jgi:hypothetical protein